MTFPDASTTGPAAGGYTTLTPVTISTETSVRATGYPSWVTPVAGGGFLVSGVAFTLGAPLDIYANNVTFQGCTFNSTATATGSTPLGVTLRGTGPYVFDYCAMYGSLTNRLMLAIDMVTDSNLTVKNCNIYYVKQAVNIFSGTVLGVTITGNYMHDVAYFTGDHSEPIYAGASAGGSNINISGNTLLIPLNQTAVIYLNPAYAFSNCVVSGNLLAGGAYALYCGGSASSGVSFEDNEFSTMYYTSCGLSGTAYPTTPPVWGASGNVWGNNTWYDGANAGQLIAGP